MPFLSKYLKNIPAWITPLNCPAALYRAQTSYKSSYPPALSLLRLDGTVHPGLFYLNYLPRLESLARQLTLSLPRLGDSGRPGLFCLNYLPRLESLVCQLALSLPRLGDSGRPGLFCLNSLSRHLSRTHLLL